MTPWSRAAAQPRRYGSLAAVAAAAALLSWPAVFNGYPLVYSDTGTYLSQGFAFAGVWDRPPYYGLFLRLFSLGRTLWLIPVVQGLMLAWVMWLFATRLVGRLSISRYLLAVGIISVASSAPWFSSQLMPDAFTSATILIVTILLHAPALSVVERIGLWLCLACAASVHLTHPVLALLVLGIGLVAGRFSRTPFAMGPRALLILAAVAFAVAGILLHNRLLTGRITYSPTSSLVVLARSIEDGPAREYLQASCPASGYRLCQSINDLNTKSDQLLWSGRGPFQDLYKGGMNPAEDEARNILSGTVRTRPREFVDKFRANAWQELLSVRTTAMDISSSGHPFVSEMIRRHLPSDYPSYASSRQLTGRLHALLDPIGRFHAALALAAYPVLIGVIVFLLYMRRVLEASVFLCLGGGVLGNALMTGPLAEPLDRYQSRVAWLLTLALIVFVCRRAEHVRDQVDGAVRARA